MSDPATYPRLPPLSGQEKFCTGHQSFQRVKSFSLLGGTSRYARFLGSLFISSTVICH